MTPESSQQLAAFMDYVASNIAREIGRLHDWREKLWVRRYRAIVVSDEPDAQAERLALDNAPEETRAPRASTPLPPSCSSNC